MKIWALTKLGKTVARNVRNPDSLTYRIVHCLDRIGSGTSDQIANQLGENETDINWALGRLQKAGAVGTI